MYIYIYIIHMCIHIYIYMYYTYTYITIDISRRVLDHGHRPGVGAVLYYTVVYYSILQDNRL